GQGLGIGAALAHGQVVHPPTHRLVADDQEVPGLGEPDGGGGVRGFQDAGEGLGGHLVGQEVVAHVPALVDDPVDGGERVVFVGGRAVRILAGLPLHGGSLRLGLRLRLMLRHGGGGGGCGLLLRCGGGLPLHRGRCLGVCRSGGRGGGRGRRCGAAGDRLLRDGRVLRRGARRGGDLLIG